MIKKIINSLILKKNLIFLSIVFLFLLLLNFIFYQKLTNSLSANKSLQQQFNKVKSDLNTLKNQDQVKRNNQLNEEIDNINKTYKSSLSAYEEILKLEDEKVEVNPLREDFAQILSFLSDKNYASASAVLLTLNQKISQEQQKLLAALVTPAPNIPVSNTPPGSGFSRQNVQTDVGTFLIDIISADLNSTKVIVDTASDSDCANDCPVLSLGDYAARSGAFAGVNGSYFCPATYPSCADKKNSFDTLLMNKNKHYFNSDNNIYSTVPAAIFSGNSVRFVAQSLEWGRDTSVDAVIANRPLLLMGENIMFSGEGEPKEGSQGNRSFVGNKGSTVYIGVVYSASVADSAKVLKTLGLDNAINLDDGGSTALWFGGYKAGPGRNIPNALLLVKK